MIKRALLWRIAIPFAAFSLVTTLVFFFFLQSETTRVTLVTDRLRLSQEARSIRALIQCVSANGRYDELVEKLGNIRAESRLDTLVLADSSGRIIPRFHNLPREEQVGSAIGLPGLELKEPIRAFLEKAPAHQDQVMLVSPNRQFIVSLSHTEFTPPGATKPDIVTMILIRESALASDLFPTVFRKLFIGISLLFLGSTLILGKIAKTLVSDRLSLLQQDLGKFYRAGQPIPPPKSIKDEIDIIRDGISHESSERIAAELAISLHAKSLEGKVDELTRIKESLSLVSERLQLATWAANIGIWDWDMVKDNLIWDDTMYRLYGVRREDSGSTYEAWSRALHPDDRAASEEASHAAMHGRHEYASEFRIVWADGSIRYIRSIARIFRDESGAPIRMVGVNWDITASKQSEEELRKSTRELEMRVVERTSELNVAREHAEAANRAKSAFLANMSHEIRTPMNAILGYSQLMRRDTSLSPAQRTRIDTINRAGGHLLTIINDILEMSKVEAGRTTFIPTAFDLHALLNEVVEICVQRARAKDINLRLDLARDAPRILVSDESKLRQTLINLVGNAVKFTEKGCVTLRVRTADVLGDEVGVRFAVTDTGPGLSAEDIAKLFRPFIQTSTGISAGGGTGLGLALGKQYAKLLGGDITVESSPGKGATFTLAIRAHTAPAEALKETVAQPGVLHLAEDQPPTRILVADDNLMNRALLDEILTPIGFEVRLVQNGREAVDMFNTWKPHAIIMDIRMPVLNGLESTRLIKATPEGRSTFILALSASAFEKEEAAVLAAGVDAFMKKPFLRNDLLTRLGDGLHLCYVYADTHRASEPGEDAPVSSQSAVVLSAALRAAITAACAEGDCEYLLQHCDTLAETDPVTASRLRKWASVFDYGSILRDITPTTEPRLP